MTQCTVGLNLVMGKFQWKLQHILYSLNKDSAKQLPRHIVHVTDGFLLSEQGVNGTCTVRRTAKADSELHVVKGVLHKLILS